MSEISQVNSDKILRFKVDTKHRKDWFTGVSFSHPAKMSLPLQLWLIENFTKPGDTILDPMAGSGTVLVACSMGRSVIAIELESKFIDIMKGNWDKIKQRGAMLGYTMGECQIIQGDARQLENILCDKIITSPPFFNTSLKKKFKTEEEIIEFAKKTKLYKEGRSLEAIVKMIKKNWNADEGLLVDKCVFSPPYGEETQKLPEDYHIPITGSPLSKGTDGVHEVRCSNDPSNIGNLPYGQVDKIITSPPYEGTVSDGKEGPGAGPDKGAWREGRAKKVSYTQHGEPSKVDSIITSPPYEETMGEKHHSPRADKLAQEKSNPTTYTDKVDCVLTSPPYAIPATGTGETQEQFEARLKRIKESGSKWKRPRPTGVYGVKDYGKEEGQIGNLPYGQIDKIVTSPPYEEAMGEKHHSPRADKLAEEKANPVTYTDRVDAILTSPPYEGTTLAGTNAGQFHQDWLQRTGRSIDTPHTKINDVYAPSETNIGNLKSTSYLEAMALVYAQCYKVLRPGGLCILIVKPFIRDQKLVPLQEHTKQLCEQVGFSFVEEWHRILPSQSFWRVIYAKRFPLAPKIDREYVLVFIKDVNQ